MERLSDTDNNEVHNGKRKYFCSGCPRKFANKTSLIYHKNRVHSQRYRCDKCGSWFGKKVRVRNHFLNAHERVRRRAQSKNHGRSVAGVKERFKIANVEKTNVKCLYCETTFNDFVSLKHHLQLHRNEKLNHKSVACDQCDKVYVTHRQLARHVRVKHSKDISCSDCDAFFRNADTWRNHKIKVHKKLDDGKQCDECLKVFANKNRLSKHIEQVHTSNRDYECQVCESTFPTRKQVSQHKKEVHRNERKFPCDYCSWASKRRNTLAHHKKTKHGHSKIM
ncbi:hypothetical protein QAD02_002581 [Eretmocerus hayati]|uniref:Uncharacterized protein n=1 Tax=Eretmocerus hayati TaxID=131215 RepID=A0ACC2NM68_9HYME|nr:hypothetical protein QAD02_002581 [Eretmocerus hayati]